MTIEPEQRVLREVVLDQLTTGEIRAYRMWLPPLTDPTPVNELIARDYQRQPLRFGLGIMDEPRRHRQEVWGIDVSAAGGNIAIGGAPQTGKSTFLQTLMLSAAATHTPRQVQFYCVDLGGGGLMYLEDLPHVGGVATRSEPDRVNRVVAEVKAVLRQREATFKQYRVGSIAAYRQMRDDPNHPAAADPFGDVFLVIDGWPAFVAEFPDLEPVVQDLAGQGLAFGVHTVISTPRWTELKSRVRDYLGTKIEFRLGDVNETQIDRITREIPANRPGRAISMEKHHLMIGVPRLDGVHSADDLVPAISAAVEHIAARHTDEAPRVRVLPERIYLHELDPHPPGPEADYRTRWTIPLGVRESDLTVAYNHMHTTPHLLIFGAPKSGKTRIAHAVAPGDLRAQQPRTGAVHAGRLPVGPAGCGAGEPSARRRGRQPQQRDTRGVDQGAGRQPAEAATAARPDHGAAAIAVVVDRSRRRAAGRRLAHDRRGRRDGPADGAAGALAARRRRHRAAHHRDLPDEPGAPGHDGQVRRRGLRRRITHDVPFRREDRSSRRARSS